MPGQMLCSLCRNTDPREFLTRIESESDADRQTQFFRVLFCAVCGAVQTKAALDAGSDDNILLRETGPRRL
jgi:hypothetical protein